MAKKPAKNPTPSLFGDQNLPAPVRSLPPSMQALFLPKLVDAAAGSIQLNAYADRSASAYEQFKKWVVNLRSGHLAKLNESQLEQDFTTGLMSALGYQTQGQVASGQPWSCQPKWPFPNGGTADVALGRFETESPGKVAGEVLVVVELKGTKFDLDKRDPKTKRTPVQQAWDYLSASDSARWAVVCNYAEYRLYSREKSKNHLHRVFLDDLDDPKAFERFFAVFHADSLLSEKRLTLNAAELLRQTDAKQKTVGDRLYELYQDQRFRLIQTLRAEKGVADLDTAIRAAQTLLDRILFIAFAEDRKLLDSDNILESTYRSQVPMLSLWDNFRNLFRAFDKGHARTGITGFNGGLFAHDPVLDAPDFELDESWPNLFQTIGGYDFRDEVSVEVLGRIFERSITDLEKLRAKGTEAYQAELEDERQKKPGRRKREGVFYTNRAIVEYLVRAALDPCWEERRIALASLHGVDPDALEVPPAAYTRALLDALDSLTVCDPACGSGAFLIAAYEWFEDHRMALLDDLYSVDEFAPECVGGREECRARSAASILKNNLYGVDLASEAVEIARLSLWIRTARKGQKLSDLSHNVVEGNSVVDDIEVHPKAFKWQERFPEVFARGGFDAVIGNPPYVRQEWLGPIKSHLAERFQAYHGMADLYVYFYERGAQVLKPGGRLAFVVTNKWMKAGYGEPLRKYFAEQAWVEQVIDFGHAKQFFPDADVFPCFLVVRRPNGGPKPEAAQVCVIPREMVKIDELKSLITSITTFRKLKLFTNVGWSLERESTQNILNKLTERGRTLSEFANLTAFAGFATGLNDAFVIDDVTKKKLIQQDNNCSEFIKPYIRGQDIERWSPEWSKNWLIFARRGIDIDKYPSLKKHLNRFRKRLEPKPIDWQGEAWPGRKPGSYRWYELQDSVDNWELLSGATPRIIFPDITWRSCFSLDTSGCFFSKTVYFLPSDDLWLLAVLNSPMIWWYAWRKAIHGKDEALRFHLPFIESLPIPTPSKKSDSSARDDVSKLIQMSAAAWECKNGILDWLKVQFEIADPSMKLRNPIALDSDAFVAEVQKVRGKSKTLTSAGLKRLRDEHASTIEPARARAAEALVLERRVNDLVNEAYGLTPEEVRLMWETAPPRMPIPRPDEPAR